MLLCHSRVPAVETNKAGLAGCGCALPPEPGIARQGAHGAGVQRHQAVLAVLAVAYHQQFPAGVEVLVIKADRFPDPDPADREQADQGLVGGCPQPGLQRGRRPDERADLGIGIQIRGGPANPRAAANRPAGMTSAEGSMLCR